MVETGGEQKLEVVLRRTRYRLEQAENDNADILARSQRQVCHLSLWFLSDQ